MCALWQTAMADPISGLYGRKPIGAQWHRIWGHMSLLTMAHSTWLRCRIFFLLLNRRTLEIPSDFEIKGRPYSKIFHLFRVWIQDFPEEELTRPRGVCQKLNENERNFTFPYEMNTNGVKAHCTEHAKNNKKVDLLTIVSIGNVDIIDLTCEPNKNHTAVLRRKKNSKNNTSRQCRGGSRSRIPPICSGGSRISQGPVADPVAG